VQTGVIMFEYINQLRARGSSIEEPAIEGAVLRLRPIMMTRTLVQIGTNEPIQVTKTLDRHS
jgi:heavy metal efflux system protein